MSSYYDLFRSYYFKSNREFYLSVTTNGVLLTKDSMIDFPISIRFIFQGFR